MCEPKFLAIAPIVVAVEFPFGPKGIGTSIHKKNNNI